MSWFRFHRRKERRPKQPKPSKPITRWARLWFEQLETRWLFNASAWLPLRLAPLDGLSATSPATPLFRPATTGLGPDLGLASATLAVCGSYTLTDTGLYTLSLYESGPDGAGSFVFAEIGLITFALTEQGSLNAGGFANSCFLLTETAFLSWSFVQTDAGGHTLVSLGGTNTSTVQGTGAPNDPFFWQGFDWYAPTQNISSLNTLGLAGLAASSLSVGEGGSESFVFQEGNGLATVQGNGTQPLADLSQTGQQSYAQTAGASFALTDQGGDSFALTELGSTGGGSYAFSSVAYNETNGGDSLGLSETVVVPLPEIAVTLAA